MGQTPEELREELSAKREDLSRDLEAIGDRVSPGRMVERRQAAVRMRFTDMRERVMGVKDSASGHLHSGASTTADTVSGAVTRVGEGARHGAEGNPFAVGIAAFGAGLVAATLFPATRREQSLAQQAQPKLEQAASQAAGKVAPMAQQVLDEVKPAATEAIEELRGEAKDAATHVAEEAKGAAQSTAKDAKSAAASAKGS